MTPLMHMVRPDAAEDQTKEAPPECANWMPRWQMLQRFAIGSYSIENRDYKMDTPVSVFLVEDNPAHAAIVRQALEEHGMEGELVVASDGEDAMQFLDRLKQGQEVGPSLAIVDLNLPTCSGLEVLQALRQNEACQSIPVAVLSCSDRRQDRDEAARMGCNLFLSKPSRVEEFLDLGRIFMNLVARHSRC